MLPSLKIFIATVTDAEVLFVAELDYRQSVEQHRTALRKLLVQGANFNESQHYYPYEVVELGAHALTPGHDREFVLCTLLVLNAVFMGYDSATDLPEKFVAMAFAYDALPSALREVVLAAYSEAGII